jgi:hypothetical protein
MAYTTPPTFATGAILTAAQLNILSANIEWFYGLTEYINSPFVTQETPKIYYMRRKHRYLHWRIVISNLAEVDNWLRVYVNTSNQAGSDCPDLTGPYTWNGSHDFNSAALGTSLNNWYPVHADVDGMVSGGNPICWYFLESPSSSL